MARLTPLEMFASLPAGAGLRLAECDPDVNPFLHRDALSETYFYGFLFDQVEMRLAMLLGIWTSLCPPPLGNVGMMVFSGVSECGWKAVGFDIPHSPHWWTILEYLPVEPDDPPRFEVEPVPGWEPQFWRPETPSRYRFVLVPDGEAIVSFKSAHYLIGTQTITEDDLRATFTADTEWHAICRWP